MKMLLKRQVTDDLVGKCLVPVIPDLLYFLALYENSNRDS
jgi:hypothetical protein